MGLCDVQRIVSGMAKDSEASGKSPQLEELSTAYLSKQERFTLDKMHVSLLNKDTPQK